MKSKIYYILCSIALISIFSSCISSEETNYLQNIDVPYSIKQYEEYRLVKGDMITCNIASKDKEQVAVFNTLITNTGGSSIGKAFTIYEDGTIILPFFGSIKVIGLTIQEAELVIQNKMQEYITDTQVKVYLATNYFYILSKDKRGSYFIYKDNMTIYQALAISQQTTERMDLSKVSIIRKDVDGNTITKTFDLRSEKVIQSEYYYIQPNDVIYFPTNKNSFFNITSVGSFLSTIMSPLAFLLFATTL